MTGDHPIALVTGAARRVGRATAIELARMGFDLVITYNTSEADAADTLRLAKKAANDKSFNASAFQVDFHDPSLVEELAEALDELPRLDALVHNASSYEASPLDELEAEEVVGHYLVNAVAPLLLSTRLAPKLAASDLPGGGAIVGFSDIHVLGRPRENYAAYAMSKAALTEMIRSLAIDLAPKIRVNAIAPGVVAWPEDADPKMIEEYEARIPLARPGTPEDAAKLVRWLILEASYLTGEIIRLDGGRWLD